MNDRGKEVIRQEMASYILGTASEWMSLIDLRVDPATGRATPDDDWQYRVSWDFPTDDAAIITVKELDHTEVARFGVQITVETLLDLPPIGPENDPAMAHEMLEWLPATFAECLAGDRIRLGEAESEVLFASAGEWHANNANPYWPVAWDHVELVMDLTANPGRRQYPPNTPCEILCSPERAAVLTMQKDFPGSQIISSDVN